MSHRYSLMDALEVCLFGFNDRVYINIIKVIQLERRWGQPGSTFFGAFWVLMDCFDLSTSPLQALWQGWHWLELENNLWILCLTRLARCFCPAKGLARGCQPCCVTMSPVVRMPVSGLPLYKCGRQTVVEGAPLPAYAEVLHLWCAFFMTSGQRHSATELQFSDLWNGSSPWAAFKLAKC